MALAQGLAGSKSAGEPVQGDGPAQEREPVVAYIGLGANLGDATVTLKAAVAALAQVPGVQVRVCSSLYRTAPIDSSGPDYLNAVAEVITTLTAPALLNELQAIENAAGRERPYRNAPRTLDLDLLLYGTAHIESTDLTVPHPRMWERAFVLVPLAEISPALVPHQARMAVAEQRIDRCESGFGDSS